jgi:hypothetical protein
MQLLLAKEEEAKRLEAQLEAQLEAERANAIC